MADRALEAGERLDLPAIVADTLITRGSVLANLGRTYEGLGVIRAGIELADELGLVSTGLRGRLNLGVLAQDPRTSFTVAEAGLEIARRFGLRGFVPILAGNLASASMDVGEWDRAVRELTVARDESPDELAANRLSWSLVSFAAWRGEDVTSEMARLTPWAGSLGDAGELAARGLRAEIAFAAGDFRAASDGWLTLAAGDTLNAPLATLMAGLAGLMALDPNRARAALDANEATGRHGRLFSLDRRLLRAGLLGLAGRASDAIREGREVLAEYERTGLPLRHAFGALALVSVAGGPDAETLGLADGARAILERLEAKPFLRLLEAALERASDPAGAAASAPRRRLPDPSVTTP